jgi:hypothetical protein
MLNKRTPIERSQAHSDRPVNQSGSPANRNFASLRRLVRPQAPPGNTAKALLAKREAVSSASFSRVQRA